MLNKLGFLILTFSFGMLQKQALAGVEGSLEGSWSQACAVVGEDEDWLTSHLQISATAQKDGPTRVMWTRRAYEEENCQKPYLDYSLAYSAQVFVGGDLNLVLEKAFYIVHTDEVARALNLVSYCGIKNWKKSVLQEVSGRDCDGFLQPSAGQALFTKAKLEMRQQKELFWGRSSGGFDGLKPETRYQEFEEVGYQEVRQKN